MCDRKLETVSRDKCSSASRETLDGPQCLCHGVKLTPAGIGVCGVAGGRLKRAVPMVGMWKSIGKLTGRQKCLQKVSTYFQKPSSPPSPQLMPCLLLLLLQSSSCKRGI